MLGKRFAQKSEQSKAPKDNTQHSKKDRQFLRVGGSSWRSWRTFTHLRSRRLCLCAPYFTSLSRARCAPSSGSSKVSWRTGFDRLVGQVKLALMFLSFFLSTFLRKPFSSSLLFPSLGLSRLADCSEKMGEF